jgi:hypothetical protein
LFNNPREFRIENLKGVAGSSKMKISKANQLNIYENPLKNKNQIIFFLSSKTATSFSRFLP